MLTNEVRRGVGLTVAIALLGAACSGDPPPPSAAAPAPCVAEQRVVALEDGTEVYVEPQNLLDVGNELLLAGAPSYAWSVAPGRDALMLGRHPYAGVYLGERPRAVPSPPLDGVLGSLMAVSLDDGRWAAVFNDVEPDSLPFGREYISAVWYAEYDGERWSTLEPMPIPSLDVSVRASSRLIRSGERLVWVAPEGIASGIHVFERVEGVWRRTRLPDDRVEQVALADGGSSGVWLLMVGQDPDLAGFQKSIRLYREGSTWELVSRAVVVTDAANQILQPQITVLPTDVTVSWIIGRRGRLSAFARTDIELGSNGTLVVLDESAQYVVPIALPDGEPAWVVDHVDPVTQAREIRLLRVIDSRVAIVAAAPSPFTGFFKAEPVSNNEVLVVGPQMGLVPTETPVRSLILRLSAPC